jgi:hypothetical protein
MTLDALIMLSGVLVAALPFLGFPNAWDTWIFFAIGVFVIALGIVVRRRYGHLENPRRPEEIGNMAHSRVDEHVQS